MKSLSKSADMKPLLSAKLHPVANGHAMKFTITRIGKAIKDGSRYIPIRNAAATAAWSSPRKDYLAQLKSLWDFFVKRWRYVKDPDGTELLQAGPKAMARLTMGLFGGIDGQNKGVGDCDDAAMALGALCRSIGFNVRICTTARYDFPMSHVFIQAFVPKIGWFYMDPVILPKRGFGQKPDFERMMIWDLDGRLLKSIDKRAKDARQGASTAPSARKVLMYVKGK